MARGWESKSVEQQQEAARRPPEPSDKISPAERKRRQQRDALRLARASVLQHLQASQDPRYSEMLKATLADLDRQLSHLA